MRHTCMHNPGDTGSNYYGDVHVCDCEEFNRDHTADQLDFEIMGYTPEIMSRPGTRGVFLWRG